MKNVIARHLIITLNLKPLLDLETDPHKSLLEEFRDLWTQADAIWDANDGEPEFRSYVSADYLAVYHSLVALQGKVSTVLEWGSGLGVVAIMASRMGFEAFGMEAESKLVDISHTLAESFHSDARFATGSFIPDAFVWNPGNGDESIATFIDDADGYGELEIELEEVDLIYAYPWPDEHVLYKNILRQFGRHDVMLLSYDAREGMDLVCFPDD
ncbi:MAG: hypothetical protein AB8B55_05240 [Mariniblastus sp.]